MNSRVLATLLLLWAGRQVLAVTEDSTTYESAPFNVASKDTALLDTERAWGNETDKGVQSLRGVEKSKGAMEGRAARLGTIILGTMNDNNDDDEDNMSVTIGLDSMFSLGTFLTALLVVAVVLGVLGIGSGLFAGIFTGLDYYKTSTGSLTPYPATDPLHDAYYQDTYATYRRLEEAQQKYAE